MKVVFQTLLTAFITLTLVTIMCSTSAKSVEPTENPSPSAEPTQDAAALSAGGFPWFLCVYRAQVNIPVMLFLYQHVPAEPPLSSQS